ncbi:hypothetical protein [Calycomorphotria hydatis]|uniref:hypothetical protein n=1 Tax=Calycomorphotria hydatis TaxID=2528027 RepID=UPI0018D21172|nr:hypothetical protein [Calycomorphotria hydatis]
MSAPQTREELTIYVNRLLCERENLLEDQFPLAVSELTQGGELCGLQFALHGPRELRLGAIWDANHNVLLCYDARGERFRKEQLAGSIDLSEVQSSAA